MSMLKALLGAAGAAALMTATIASAAAPVAHPTAAPSLRAAAPSVHGNRLGASVPTGTLISIGILAALVVVVLVATNDDDSDSN